MLALVFILPLCAALACMALDRVFPTRWTAYVAAGALALAGILVAILRFQGDLPLVLVDREWVALAQRPIRLLLQLDTANWLLVALTLGGGACAMLMLGLALPSELRRFGGLPATLLLALLATLLGLMSEDPLLQPVAWMLSALLTCTVLRASGALTGSDAPLIIALTGAAGAIILLSAVLVLEFADPGVPPTAALLCYLVASLLVIGAAPFHAAIGALADAPATLSGALVALGLPLLGAWSLMRFIAEQGALIPAEWRLALALLGLLTLLGCAAGAARATLARRLMTWQFGAQMGLFLLALSHPGGAATIIAPAVLLCAVLTTLVTALVVAILERRAGTDDLTLIENPSQLLLPGLALLISGAAAVGVPGTWGFWSRSWLIEQALQSDPWLVPVVLAGSALLAQSYFAPLALLWRAAHPLRPARPAAQSWPNPAAIICPLIVMLPLLVFGIMPQLAIDGWLGTGQTALAPEALFSPPDLSASWVPLVHGGAALLLVALPLAALRRRLRRPESDTDARVSGAPLPVALGESLGWLAWLSAPSAALNLVWEALLRFSQASIQLFARFEERYYLAGLMIALIIVILVFI